MRIEPKKTIKEKIMYYFYLLNHNKKNPKHLNNIAFRKSYIYKIFYCFCASFYIIKLKLTMKNPSHIELCRAVKNNEYTLTKILLNAISDHDVLSQNMDITFEEFINYCIITSVENSHFDILYLLIEDPRVDSSYLNNFAINKAYKAKQYNLVNLLWKEKQIKETLVNDNLNLYQKLIPKDIKKKVEAF